MAGDLFDETARREAAARAPLATRLRPRTLDEVVGHEELLGPGRPLRVLVETDRLGSAILWGPPGSGKTTLASIVAGVTRRRFVPMSAVTAGVADVRAVVQDAREALGMTKQGTIVFLDEIHRFSRTQQDALLPAVEEGLIVLIGATTENPYASIVSPLLSRTTLWRLEPLGTDALETLVRRAVAAEEVEADEEMVAAIAVGADGDARAAIGTVEVAASLVRRGTGGPGRITPEVLAGARRLRMHHAGTDAHYEVASAFIKSIRGSDVDAGLYWLAVMLQNGEDPRFIARRLVILASEDVGEADPLALVVATAASRALEEVGLPEARLALAQAVVHLAAAPKSNRVTVALSRAMEDAAAAAHLDVPVHLRPSGAPGGRAEGHGEGYLYPHDHPGGWVDQQYRPDAVAGHRYYEPTDRGHEAAIATRLGELGAGSGGSGA